MQGTEGRDRQFRPLQSVAMGHPCHMLTARSSFSKKSARDEGPESAGCSGGMHAM